MPTAQPFGIVLDDASPLDCDAFALATELADYPALHPDHFRFLLPVMLPQHHRPVPCVATLAVDDSGLIAMDDTWIFLPGNRARKVKQGEDFDLVKTAVFGPHIEDVMVRAAEHRAPFRGRAVVLPDAAEPIPMPAEIPPLLGMSPLAIRKRFFGPHAA